MAEKSNPYATLIQMMREQGTTYNPPSIMLAEVLTPPPNLTIKMGDIQIDKDNILIAESLLSTFSRTCTITGTMDETGTLTFSASNVGNTGSASVGDHGSHSHSIPSISVNGSNGHMTGNITADLTIDFTDTLEKGDIVAVMPTLDRQTYIILNKVVSL